MHSTRTATRARATAFVAALATSMIALSACGGSSEAGSSDDAPQDGTYLGTADSKKVQLKLVIDDGDVTLEEIECRINTSDSVDNSAEVAEPKTGTLKEGTHLYWDGESTYTELKSGDEGSIFYTVDAGSRINQGFSPTEEDEAEQTMDEFKQKTCPAMKM